MASKSISVKLNTTKPDNALELDADGLYAPKHQIIYFGVTDHNGEGLLPDGWKKPVHKPGFGYWLFPHPQLVKENYTFVCAPRIPYDVDLTDHSVHPIKPKNIPPVFIFVHDLEADHVHLQIVDKDGKPTEHGFTWIIIAK